jgi:hypothetical protein
MQTGLHEKSF